MLHEEAREWKNRWRIAAVISMLLCMGVVYLWSAQPGQLYTFRNDGTEYSLRADFRCLLVMKWSAQGGLRILWSLPLWPFVLLTGVPPLVILWKLGPCRAKQPRGFPVEKQKHPR
jgi:hypothetical protein